MIHAPNRGLLAATLLLCAPAAFAVSSGITGQSGRPGSGNCSSCHSGTAFTYNLPALTGTTTVAASSSTNYTLSFTKASGNDAIAAGFNLAATSGTLVDPNAAGCPLKKSGTELTHSSPCTPGGSFSWTFSWTAPAAAGDYTFYFCARAVNGNGNSTGDSIGKCSSAVITVTAPPANNPPEVANTIPDQDATEDSLFTFTFADNTFNDPDGDPLTYSAAQPGGGALPSWLSFTGSTRTFSGTPLNADVGALTVRVTATDTAMASATDDFVITVANVNDAPVAVNDSFTVARNSSNNTLNVLANDTDVDMGDALTITSVGTPNNGGSATINTGGVSLNYTPAANFSGTEVFTYTIQDASGATDDATVTITVPAPAPANSAPAANNDSYSTPEDVALTIAPSGVLANDTDADGDSLTAVRVAGPANGTLTLSANGGFTYTPNANFNGSDSFTYRANDGTANSNTATATITVTAVNDTPVAMNDNYTTPEDTVLTVSVQQGVLSNDTDADGNTLAAFIVSGPANGALTLNSNGGFTYTPDTNFNGSDSFTYKANDGATDSNIATVTIMVGLVNDPPAANADSYTASQNTPLTVAAAQGVLANDTDSDGDPLAAVLVTAPSSGTLGLNPNGGFTYTPNAGFSGADSFTYQASDGVADSNVATVTINVNTVAPPPAGGGGGGGGGGSPAAVLLGLLGLASLLKRGRVERQA